MIPLPFWLTNLQFIIGAAAAFAFFAAAWLNVDSWAVRREVKTGLRAAGFFSLALWSALHGIDITAPWASVLAAILMAGGSVACAASYLIDRPPQEPRTASGDAEQQKKIEQIVAGPPEAKPHPPSPGAPLERASQRAAPAAILDTRATARQPLPATASYARPSTPTAKAIGLRTEALLKLPKRDARRRTRWYATTSFIIFCLIGAAGAYYLYAKVRPFRSELAPEASFVETTASPEPSPTPSPSPTEAAADASDDSERDESSPRVTIKATETGYLNVRESASTTAAILTKINPGDQYEWLEENEAGDWYKIQVDDNTAGWIAARYATKNEE